ncbi:hypothetical protein CYLTODRAFT_425208 [Cylindrobasidium torrendii FP15055 ss-10]|uniref:DUF7587 domain-containing protein n=1 Tax=Cylindrobasidium torrendii FP15055 ss-10 TaxID=1314674 RepID=A0A0D7B2L1_9AGAR|nr:hypothetical protein CYLTODRAFT_425208 [Cylindrobasidium torrendii FP15055 ss-10]
MYRRRSLLFRVVDRQTDIPNPDNGAYESGFCRSSSTMPQDTHEAEKESIIRHVSNPGGNWGKSPFLSTSASFLWCMWEAGRRAAQCGRKADEIHILVLDASPLEREGSLRWLNNVDAPYRQWFLGTQFYTWIDNSKEVLVKYAIPSYSILGRVNYVDIQRNSPSFFPVHLKFEDWRTSTPRKKKTKLVYGSFSAREGDVMLRFKANSYAANFATLIDFVNALTGAGTSMPRDVALAIASNLALCCSGGVVGTQPDRVLRENVADHAW